MSGEQYNKEYYQSGNYASTPYEEPAHWIAFFGNIADHIVEELKPATVLDAGCAMGYLVAALRDRGVEAYGLDISEYAISKVREDIRPYCFVGSLTEPLPEDMPRHYDLIVTIEVLEHLIEEDGIKAINHLTSLSEQILFSSTPDDMVDPTHINVQQREYWVRLFTEQGFYDDLTYSPLYVTAYALFFRKGFELYKSVENYERYIGKSDAAARKQRAEIETLKIASARQREQQNAQEQTILEQRVRIEQLEAQNRELGMTIETQRARIEQLEAQNRYLSESFDIISNSACWKITKPVRFVLDVLKWALRPRAEKGLLRKGLYSLRTNGLRVTWQKAMYKIYFGESYTQIAKQALFSEEELAEQRSHQFPRKIKFSIVVPLYNTPEPFLRAMIESVLAQTYGDWELCMADGSDAAHRDVERVCREYVEKDSRIRYRKLERNLGISGNTNACLEMAKGDYIALFDHDDLLHPAALYEVMRAICDLNADFIYTDESTFHDTPEDAYLPHFKPAFAPDSLRGINYICHFTVFKRSLLQEVGLFDPACDGSQDHDMVLRLTEKAGRVAHIPEILYYWRAHADSVAESAGIKPYVIEAGVRAVEKQLERLGLEGTVEPVKPGLTFYRIRYAIKGTPKVSILIPNYEHLDDLKTCLDSIFKKTSWPNYEIVIVENNSSSPALFDYYEKLQKERENVRVVSWQGKFNYSAINNYGTRFCSGEYLLLLNNDTEVITPDWIQEMLMFAQRSDVGAVGCKLYYPDDTLQHAGVILGIGGVAGHSHKYFKRRYYGYMSRLAYAQDFSAVTAACMMLRRKVWDQVNGLDEAWAVAFNDVDLCMRIRKAGWLIVWTPFAELYHYESKSRGTEKTPKKQARFNSEGLRFQQRWKKELAAGDPYYNPNLTLEREDFSVGPVVRQHDAR